MNELEKARKQIDEIDEKMAKLFCERMDASRQVAMYKKDHGLRVFDPVREEAVMKKSVTRIEDEELRGYFVNFVRANMEISKAYQARLLDGMRIAFSGVEGAFASIAAKRVFPTAKTVGYGDFEAAYRSVERGECDAALLPIENSTNGDVGQVMDLAFFGSLYVSGVYDIEIVQNLLGVRGATINDVKTVTSHPQALGQCKPFISSHGFEAVEAVNTAVAAANVVEKNDKTVAAIGSEEAARIYGLDILQSHINEKGSNTTRFAVFTRAMKEPSPGDAQFIMLFTVKNEAGALARAVNTIGSHGINLRAIKSRPTKQISWSYYFFCEGEGCLVSDNGKQMVEELKQTCNDLKIIGSFEKEILM